MALGVREVDRGLERAELAPPSPAPCPFPGVALAGGLGDVADIEPPQNGSSASIA
jgi:hypothetical protein